MDYCLVFLVGIFVGVALGWDHVRPSKPPQPSPMKVAREIEEAAEEIERIKRDTIRKMRDL